jgi:HPt (histidine-containing phosphotransfer) domain-containing protein
MPTIAGRATTAAKDAPMTVSPVRLDPEMLEQLDLLEKMGRSGIRHKLASLYLENSATLMATIATARASGDLETLRRSFHSLKSTSASLGAGDFAKLCAGFESEAKQGLLPTDPDRYRTLESDYAAVRLAVTGLLDS